MQSRDTGVTKTMQSLWRVFSFPLLPAGFVGRQLTCAEFPCGEAHVTTPEAPQQTAKEDLRLSVQKPTGELGSRSYPTKAFR